MKTVRMIANMMLVLGVLLTPVASQAQEPVNIQGSLKLTGGGTPADGLYNMRFELFDSPAGGSLLYSKSFVGGGAVSVVDGLYSIVLGDAPAFSATLFQFAPPLYLEVTVDSDNSTTFEPGEIMSSRIELFASPFSNYSLEAEKLAPIDQTIDGNLTVNGDTDLNGTLDATAGVSAPASGPVHEIRATTSSTGSASIDGIFIRTEMNGTTSGFNNGVLVRTLTDASSFSLSSGVQSQLYYDGANANSATGAAPIIVGLSSQTGIEESLPASIAVEAFGVGSLAISEQAGSNVGVAGGAGRAAKYNVGVAGATGTDTTIAAALGYATTLPAGLNTGGLFVNLDIGPLDYALFVEGTTHINGRTSADVTVDSPSTVTSSFNIHSLRAISENTGSQWITGLKIRTEARDSDGNLTYGLHSQTYSDMSGANFATGSTSDALYIGPNSSITPGDMPIVVGSIGTAGLSPSVPASRAVFAVGSIGASFYPQAGGNIGVIGAGALGGTYNVGVAGASGSSTAVGDAIGFIAGLPTGLRAGGMFVNPDATALDFALLTYGPVAFREGTFTQAHSGAPTLAAATLVLPVGNVHSVTGVAAPVDTIPAAPAGTQITLIVAPGPDPLTLVDGFGNLNLAAGPPAILGPGSTIVLVSDGTTWFEISRSMN